ncbi:hypothetical protein [Pseudoalteromonas sp. SWYJZ19]|uniref:hypothetical protein n=1 Tax=Pseudoalteromonas sp. SWYJZ19 TaxID=2792068 RepID=UPI0018CD4911|nr:hypothetical protein [Pseudoalteromonas sp. SWYJZ19]MBH0050628.1 hypothetical protein [Pseudoalteromonas sp. SWYJZ19]
MYRSYFKEWDVKSDFVQEFVTLWDGWLGEDECYKLDLVTEKEWCCFNNFIKSISNKYKLMAVDCDSEKLIEIDDINKTLSTYKNSINKGPDSFSKYVIPELNCIITEEWDYTYIIWHKNNGALEKLIPLINEVGLKNFGPCT